MIISLQFLYFNTQLNFIHVYTLQPEQNGHHFADDNVECTLLIANFWVLIEVQWLAEPPLDVNTQKAMWLWLTYIEISKLRVIGMLWGESPDQDSPHKGLVMRKTIP